MTFYLGQMKIWKKKNFIMKFQPIYQMMNWKKLKITKNLIFCLIVKNMKMKILYYKAKI